MRLGRSLRIRANRFLEVEPYEAARLAGVRIGTDVRLVAGSSFGRHASISIGDHSWFSGPLIIDGEGSVSIDRWVAVGRNLSIVTSGHDVAVANLHFGLADLIGLPRPIASVGEVVLGSACWIGDGVMVLGGGSVGIGAVVGARSVVTTSIPPFAVAAGTPARVIRQRFKPPTVEALLGIAWWEWPDERVRRNRSFFEADPATLEPSALRDLVVD